MTENKYEYKVNENTTYETDNHQDVHYRKEIVTYSRDDGAKLRFTFRHKYEEDEYRLISGFYINVDLLTPQEEKVAKGFRRLFAKKRLSGVPEMKTESLQFLHFMYERDKYLDEFLSKKITNSHRYGTEFFPEALQNAVEKARLDILKGRELHAEHLKEEQTRRDKLGKQESRERNKINNEKRKQFNQDFLAKTKGFSQGDY